MQSAYLCLLQLSCADEWHRESLVRHRGSVLGHHRFGSGALHQDKERERDTSADGEAVFPATTCWLRGSVGLYTHQLVDAERAANGGGRDSPRYGLKRGAAL